VIKFSLFITKFWSVRLCRTREGYHQAEHSRAHAFYFYGFSCIKTWIIGVPRCALHRA